MAKIKHIEVAGRDGERLSRFYGALFDWSISKRDVAGFDYYDVEADGGPSCGIRHEPQGQAEIVVYVEVDDLDAAIVQARELGATVRVPPMEHEGMRFALVEDPENNPIGLIQA